MTTLMIPSFERGLLQTVREGLAAGPVRQWAQRSLRLCLDILRTLRENADDMRRALEDELAGGVEARSLARSYGPLLPPAEEDVAAVQKLIDRLSPTEDAAAESLAAELRLLEEEHKAFRDLLAGALSRASAPPRPVDWDRVRAAEEAHASGETKPFSRR